MNILGNNASKLNEIIFEKRNKNYGAYVIRESYNDSLFKSLLCLSGMIALLFLGTFLYNKTNPIAIENIPAIVDDLTDLVTPIDITPMDQLTQPRTAAPTAPAGATLGTEVIDTAPETNSVNLNNSITGVGSPSATGVAPTGPESTVTAQPIINTIPAIVPVDVVGFADEMPEFEGGVAGLMRFIGQNIVYPEGAKAGGVEGKVFVSFVVNELGNVESAKLIKGIGAGCDEEVIRVMNKMPRWKKVGKNAGHPVKVRFTIPVVFKIR